MSVIIRLQNLPWSANASDIRQFFRGLSIPEGGVHIVGGEHGDAFIAFSSDEDARQAMALSGEKLQEAPVKLFLSSRTEMQRVIDQTRSGVTASSVSAPTLPGLAAPATAATTPSPALAAIPGLANPMLPLAGGILPFDPTALFAAFQNPQLAATYAAFLQAAAMAQSAATLKVEKPASTVAGSQPMSTETLAAFGLPQPKDQPVIQTVTPPVSQPLLPSSVEQTAVQPVVQSALQQVTLAKSAAVLTATQPTVSITTSLVPQISEKQEDELEVEIVTPVVPPAPEAPTITDRKPPGQGAIDRKFALERRPEARLSDDDRERSRSSRRSRSPRDSKRGSRSRSHERDRDRRDRRRGRDRDRSRSRDRRSRSRSRDRRYRRSPGRDRRREVDEFGRDRSRGSFERDNRFEGGRSSSPQRGTGPVPVRGDVGDRPVRPPGAVRPPMHGGPPRPAVPGAPQRPMGPGVRPMAPGAPVRQDAPIRQPIIPPMTSNSNVPVFQTETAVRIPESPSRPQMSNDRSLSQTRGILERPQGLSRPLLDEDRARHSPQSVSNGPAPLLEQQGDSERKGHPPTADERPSRNFRDPRTGSIDAVGAKGPARRSRFENLASSPNRTDEELKKPPLEKSPLIQKLPEARQSLLPLPGQSEPQPEAPSRCLRFYSGLPSLSYKSIRATYRGIIIRGDGIKLLRCLDGTLASIAFIRFETMADKKRALSVNLPHLSFVSEASEKEFEQAIDDYSPEKFNREMLFDSCFAIRNIPNEATVEYVKGALFGFDILDVALEVVTHEFPNNVIAYIRFSTFQEAERAVELLSNGVVFGDVVLPVILTPIEQYFRAKLGADTLTMPTPLEPKPAEIIKTELTFVKGLPKSVTDRDVLDFFSDAGVFPVRIHFLLNQSNEPSGDAVIEFGSPSDAEKATAKHRSMMGLNVIEVTLISKKDAAQMVPHISDALDNVDMEIEDESSPVPKEEDAGEVPSSDLHQEAQDDSVHLEETYTEEMGEEIQENGKSELGHPVPFTKFMNTAFEERSILGPRGPLLGGPRSRPLLGAYPVQDVRPFVPRSEPRVNFRPQDLIRGSKPRQQDPRGMDRRAPAPKSANPFSDPECVLALSNIPYKAGVDEILEFFAEFDLKKEQVLRRFADGFPTSDARVVFSSPAEARRALKLNGSRMWNRVITVSPMTAL